jgi:hypothetical protein
MARLHISEVVCAVVLALAMAAPASATVATLSNDSIGGGAPSGPGNYFIPGEEVAARLTSTCDGFLVEAQVYWLSQFGGAPASLETDITIYAAGTHPTPGAVLTNQGGSPAVIVAPTLLDGVMNSFRFLDPPLDTTPLRVPVTTGQSVVVSLEHLNQNSGNVFAPGVGYDAACQGGLNSVKAVPGGWLDACGQGVPGDWVIRAVVDCEGVSLPSSTPHGLAVLAMLLVAAGISAGGRSRSGPPGRGW